MAILTGRRRHRSNWRRQLILQVEERFTGFPYGSRPMKGAEQEWCQWRDARVTDLFQETSNSKETKTMARDPDSTPQEKMIGEALAEIEMLGAHPLLTESATLLLDAMLKIAEWRSAGRPGGNG